MEEMKPHPGQITHPDYVVVMKKAAFTWDTHRNYDVKPVGDQDFEITGEMSKEKSILYTGKILPPFYFRPFRPLFWGRI